MKTFCPIPWIFQAVRNNGDIRLCCHANITKNQGIIKKSSGEPYNASNDSLKEAFNADLIKTVRLNMLKNEWSDECKRCMIEEESGIRSRRQNELSQWNFTFEDAKLNTNDIGETNLSPIYYDLRFGNYCNLTCRMCGPTDSHQWYKEWQDFHQEDGFYDTHGRVNLDVDKNGRLYTSQYDWHMDEKFWNQIENIIPNLQHVYMAGGEPLIIERHYDFLKLCVDNGYAKNIIIEYNTNLTSLPNKVFNLWKNFKEIRLGISIDGIDKVLEYQRYPIKWKTLEKNLVRINDYIENSKNCKAWFTTTVTAYNVMHIPEFLAWKLNADLDNIRISNYNPILKHHMQHMPYRTNIQVFPKSFKEIIQEKYNKWLDHFDKSNLKNNEIESIHRIMNNITTYMNKEDLSNNFDEFIKFTKFLDKSRKQDILEIIPELKSHM